MPDQSDWDDDEDFTSPGDTTPPPPLTYHSAEADTVQKTITQTDNSLGRARRKTGFPIRKTRSTAVVSG